MSKDQRVIKPDALNKLRRTIIELFADGQFHEVGIRQICVKAKVSPQTVYKYFGNKDSLLMACMEDDIRALCEKCSKAINEAEDPEQGMINFCRTFFQHYSENPMYARILYLNLPHRYWLNHSSPSRDAMAMQLLQLVMTGQQNGVFNADVNPVTVIDIITGAGNRIIARWLINGEQGPLIEQADAYIKFIQDGMLIRK